MKKKSKRAQSNRRKKRKKLIKYGTLLITMIMVIGILWNISDYFNRTKKVAQPDIKERLLTPNPYSRPEIPLKKVKGIVIHYTANPGSDAEANRNYFDNMKITHETYASSHYIIGLDGTIIQCIPLNEIAYASNKRNDDTISIECCHPDNTGEFTQDTYEALVKLSAWLAGKYNLKEEDIIRHYDITGKECPRFFVKNQDKWEQYRKEVFVYIENNSN
jgi:N-acetylmuramoyl-L-alanine amidase